MTRPLSAAALSSCGCFRQTKVVLHGYNSGGVETITAKRNEDQIRELSRSAVVREKIFIHREARQQNQKSPSDYEHVIGIDLGTTNSCITYYDRTKNRTRVIPNPDGSWTFPTAVAFDGRKRFYGETARAMMRSAQDQLVTNGKRLIGRRRGELTQVLHQLGRTNTLEESSNGEMMIVIRGRQFHIVHIMGMFLRYLKEIAELHLKGRVEACVISVPAYFTARQKVATEDAALVAGFDVLEVIDEPSAACLAYTALSGQVDGNSMGAPTQSHGGKKTVKYLIFDLGGGTLDCALMSCDLSDNAFALIGTDGDPLLGGNDWDNIISGMIAKSFKNRWNIDIDLDDGFTEGDRLGMQRTIQHTAERCKVHFTSSTETFEIYERLFCFKNGNFISLAFSMTYDEYVRVSEDLRHRCVSCIQKLLRKTGVDKVDVDNVLLVGAMTRDPPLRRTLDDYFRPTGLSYSGDNSIEPSSTSILLASESCPPDYAVALGAGVRAAMLQEAIPAFKSQKKIKFVDGTIQAEREANRSVLSALYKKTMNFFSPSTELNPRAAPLGHRVRRTLLSFSDDSSGCDVRVQGLSDDEIEKFAKEIVFFNTCKEREEQLQKILDEADHVIKNFMQDSSRKQGMQEKKLLKMQDQLKFWQYMVTTFHDHEEHLRTCLNEAKAMIADVDGRWDAYCNEERIAEQQSAEEKQIREKLQHEAFLHLKSEKMQNNDERIIKSKTPMSHQTRRNLNSDGTINFSADLAENTNRSITDRNQEIQQQVIEFPELVNQIRPSERTLLPNYDLETVKAIEEEKEMTAHLISEPPKRKVLRRSSTETPKINLSTETRYDKTKMTGLQREIIFGSSQLANLCDRDGAVPSVTESASNEVFLRTVQDRVWREQPPPPGEVGMSWAAVQAKLEKLPTSVVRMELLQHLSCMEDRKKGNFNFLSSSHAQVDDQDEHTETGNCFMQTLDENGLRMFSILEMVTKVDIGHPELSHMRTSSMQMIAATK